MVTLSLPTGTSTAHYPLGEIVARMDRYNRRLGQFFARCWVNAIPEGYEDDEGFHYRQGNTRSIAPVDSASWIGEHI